MLKRRILEQYILQEFWRAVQDNVWGSGWARRGCSWRHPHCAARERLSPIVEALNHQKALTETVLVLVSLTLCPNQLCSSFPVFTLHPIYRGLRARQLDSWVCGTPPTCSDFLSNVLEKHVWETKYSAFQKHAMSRQAPLMTALSLGALRLGLGWYRHVTLSLYPSFIAFNESSSSRNNHRHLQS